jgi:2-oxoglutarate ferredoxin oxidoreductase subunit alpha
MAAAKKRTSSARRAPIHELASATVRFAGDAGDGMQLAGARFTAACAMSGNDVSTIPDLPAEIRAPAGTLAGVSSFQVHFSKNAARTPGDALDALVAMNPAALRTHLRDLQSGGLLIVNTDAFAGDALIKAGYAGNPLADGALKDYCLVPVAMNQLNREAVAELKLSPREADRCRGFFVLGLVCRLFDKPLEPTLGWIQEKLVKNPAVLEANRLSLRAGHHYGDTLELPAARYRVAPVDVPKGRYRTVTGMDALVLGLVTATRGAELSLVFAGAPSVPAGDMLRRLAELKEHEVFTIQAEDESAALAMALGASFGGAMGVTATSGPGMSLAADGLGLAVMAELPAVIINLQRGGPSTGLPTKTEQADLFQAMFGRHGECPLPVLAPSSPADCFALAHEAVRLAVRYMTPVVLLADVHLANRGERWQIPDGGELPSLTVEHPAASKNGEPFMPYARNERHTRPWAIPGTPGLEHRIGGLEKEDKTGNVSYDPANHETMVKTRATKIARIAEEIPELEVHGGDADLLVIGWGSTHGVILSAVARARAKGVSVACAHLRHLYPLPRNLGDVLKRFKKILVPELNSGQLLWLLRARFPIDAVGHNKTQGAPFLIREIEAKIAELVSGVRDHHS